MKNEKKLCGFSFSINIANFEAFCWTKKLISNLFFLKSVKEALRDKSFKETIFKISAQQFNVYMCNVVLVILQYLSIPMIF